MKEERGKKVCPFGQLYTYRRMSKSKKEKEAVKCLYLGSIHGPKIYIHCLGNYQACPTYQGAQKGSQLSGS